MKSVDKVTLYALYDVKKPVWEKVVQFLSAKIDHVWCEQLNKSICIGWMCGALRAEVLAVAAGSASEALVKVTG